MSTQDRHVRVLSIRQPWLELILAGRKTVEVRSWNTAFRGTLLLHANQHVPTRRELDHVFDDITEVLGGYKAAIYHLVYGTEWEMRTGLVLGCARVAAVRPYTSPLRFRGLYPVGVEGEAFAWELTDVERIEPGLPWVGARGLRIPSRELLLNWRELAGRQVRA